MLKKDVEKPIHKHQQKRIWFKQNISKKGITETVCKAWSLGEVVLIEKTAKNYCAPHSKPPGRSSGRG